ncbi:MAG: hypothetical protein ABI543_01100 [Ignavibacteria bacterium]
MNMVTSELQGKLWGTYAENWVAIAVNKAGEEKVRETVSKAISHLRQPSGAYILKNIFKCIIAEN